MKKFIAFAVVLLAVLSAVSCKSGPDTPYSAPASAETGPLLGANIARVYTPASRESRFILNGEPIEGSVVGKAYFDAAADGRTALAWVDTVVYFVSEKGVDRLGAGISTAELSFKGDEAFYQLGDKLYKYSLETRSSEVVDEGIMSVIQFAISPSGASVMFTAVYNDAPGEYRTKLLRGGSLAPALEGMAGAVIAVSDDAETVWYMDPSKGFCADVGGETRVVSAECDAASNYNFTSDLGEVIFSTKDGRQILYRLGDGKTSELGTGFGYSIKTEIYSMSKVTLFSYINDVLTFENGLFMLRNTVGESYAYTVGLIRDDFSVSILAENAKKYAASPDGERIIWLKDEALYSTDMSGKTEELSSSAVSFDLSPDGKTLLFITSEGLLYSVKDGSFTEIDGSVSSCAALDGCFIYIKDKTGQTGTLCSHSAEGGTRELMPNVSRFNKRHGQVLVYADPEAYGDTDVYTLFISTNGLGLTKISEGVEP